MQPTGAGTAVDRGHQLWPVIGLLLVLSILVTGCSSPATTSGARTVLTLGSTLASPVSPSKAVPDPTPTVATTAVTSNADSAGAGESSSSAGVDCAFTLSPVFGSGPVWAEAAVDSGFSCEEMKALWQQYEDWPGGRGGTMAVVNFPDGSYCTGIAYEAAPAGTSAVGGCDVAGRRFTVWRGEPGQRTIGTSN